MKKAKSLELTGWVRNLPGGKSVEVEAEGKRERLDSFSRWLKEGPPGAVVDRVDVEWAEYTAKYSDFSIKY
jgi:acylphosphatase